MLEDELFPYNTQQDHIWLKRDEFDEITFWRSKMIKKLLLTVTIADLQQLN